MSSESRGALGAPRPATALRARRTAGARRVPRPAAAPRAVARRATAALLSAVMVAVAACSSGPTPAPPMYTAVPIGPTSWPSGTVGQYGLKIDPSLMGKLPATVGALPLLEDPGSEMGALNDADLANSFDGYAAASIGSVVGGSDWLYVAIGRRKPDKQTPDFFEAWVEQYATGACSQANGVADSGQQQIGDWTVDVSTCNGGPVVYTLPLDESLLLSMWGMGPRDLGRMLIENLR